MILLVVVGCCCWWGLLLLLLGLYKWDKNTIFGCNDAFPPSTPPPHCVFLINTTGSTPSGLFWVCFGIQQQKQKQNPCVEM